MGFSVSQSFIHTFFLQILQFSFLSPYYQVHQEYTKWANIPFMIYRENTPTAKRMTWVPGSIKSLLTISEYQQNVYLHQK